MFSVQCTNCGANLKTSKPIEAGKKVKCPKCAEAFVAQEEEKELDNAGAFEEEVSRPRKPVKAARRRDEEELDDDDELQRKPVKSAKSRRGAEDDEEEEDERPKKKGKGKKTVGDAKSNKTLLYVLLGTFGILFIAAGVVFAVFWGDIFGRSQTQNPNPQDEPRYTLKFKDAAEGEYLHIKKSTTETLKVKVADEKGKVLVDKNKVTTKEREYKEMIYKRAAGKPIAKRRVEYIKAEILVDKNKRTIALQGNTFFVERLDGDRFKYTYLNNLPVPGDLEVELGSDFGKNEDVDLGEILLPKAAVKVGESWNLDMPKLIKKFAGDTGMEVNADSSTGTGVLVKAYQKDNKQFGELKIEVDLNLQTMDGHKLAPGAKMKMNIEFDGCVDGTSTAGTMKSKKSMSARTLGPPPATDIDVVMEVTREQTEIPRTDK